MLGTSDKDLIDSTCWSEIFPEFDATVVFASRCIHVRRTKNQAVIPDRPNMEARNSRSKYSIPHIMVIAAADPINPIFEMIDKSVFFEVLFGRL